MFLGNSKKGKSWTFPEFENRWNSNLSSLLPRNVRNVSSFEINFLIKMLFPHPPPHQQTAQQTAQLMFSVCISVYHIFPPPSALRALLLSFRFSFDALWYWINSGDAFFHSLSFTVHSTECSFLFSAHHAKNNKLSWETLCNFLKWSQNSPHPLTLNMTLDICKMKERWK